MPQCSRRALSLSMPGPSQTHCIRSTPAKCSLRPTLGGPPRPARPRGTDAACAPALLMRARLCCNPCLTPKQLANCFAKARRLRWELAQLEHHSLRPNRARQFATARRPRPGFPAAWPTGDLTVHRPGARSKSGDLWNPRGAKLQATRTRFLIPALLHLVRELGGFWPASPGARAMQRMPQAGVRNCTALGRLGARFASRESFGATCK